MNVSKYKLEHHQLISCALQNFNSEFLSDNHILFGGGTRIALELDEYRESVDIDFLCQDKRSYRAVREQVTNRTLGKIVKKQFEYSRDIMTNRDAVRTLIKVKDVTIKLEFVCFDNYALTSESNSSLFPVPSLDHDSCFYTKLLANADRYNSAPYKDIFDIVVMYGNWGDIPQLSIEKAISHYGKDTVINNLKSALSNLIESSEKHLKLAIDMSISKNFFDKFIQPNAIQLLHQLEKDSS